MQIVPESGNIATSFRVDAFPTHFIIDRNGRLVWEALGAHPDNIKRLRTMLQRLLGQ